MWDLEVEVRSRGWKVIWTGKLFRVECGRMRKGGNLGLISLLQEESRAGGGEGGD